MKTATENQIQNQILEYLQYKKIYCWRQNTAGIYSQKGGFYRKSPMRGVSDIIGIAPNGRFIAIEVKRKGGELSLEQSVFLDEIRKNNGVALLAYSMEDVREELKAQKII